MLKALGLIALTLPLMAASCDPAAMSRAACPRIKQYSQETQAKALAEFEAVERQAPTLTMMFGDYLALRDAVQVCVKQRESGK